MILMSLGLMAYYVLSTHCQFANMSLWCLVVFALQILFAALSRLLIINLFAQTLGNFVYVYTVIVSQLLIEVMVHLTVDFKNGRTLQLSMNFFLKRLVNNHIIYHPEEDSLTKFYIIEFVILLENMSFWAVLFSQLDSTHLVILSVTWSFYWVSVLLKVIFYLVMHPSSAKIYEQVKSKQYLFKTFHNG